MEKVGRGANGQQGTAVRALQWNVANMGRLREGEGQKHLTFALLAFYTVASLLRSTHGRIAVAPVVRF